MEKRKECLRIIDRLYVTLAAAMGIFVQMPHSFPCPASSLSPSIALPMLLPCTGTGTNPEGTMHN
jgi:hypothetical protein